MFRVCPEHSAEFEEVMSELSQRTHGFDAGCIEFAVFRIGNRPIDCPAPLAQYALIEKWEHQVAFDAHLKWSDGFLASMNVSRLIENSVYLPLVELQDPMERDLCTNAFANGAQP